ncbi:hypothetical protein GDO81_024182 [Engystomops pustulosus]|uniref:Secreted protein n=1 Tax=Engystomops pustulosus TaxID=76066 RepID=A0AAV6Z256_ENGPU|nr:hypothetical protein GDO81_024182 [Engystomops pustulosus]
MVCLQCLCRSRGLLRRPSMLQLLHALHTLCLCRMTNTQVCTDYLLHQVDISRSLGLTAVEMSPACGRGDEMSPWESSAGGRVPYVLL